MNRLFELSHQIPIPDTRPTVAYAPVILPMKGRPPMELRVTAPVLGRGLPIVLFSHGYGPSNYIPSKDGYAHLAQFWAERGMAVIQPTMPVRGSADFLSIRPARRSSLVAARGASRF